MKLLMIIVDDEHKEELEVYLAEAGLEAYTEIPRTLGMGATGPHLGSRAFPRTSAIIFSIIDDGMLESLRTGLTEFKEKMGIRAKIVAWQVDEVV